LTFSYSERMLRREIFEKSLRSGNTMLRFFAPALL
jgi:hypothetical protein